jgi:hypothetical protein
MEESGFVGVVREELIGWQTLLNSIYKKCRQCLVRADEHLLEGPQEEIGK